RGLLLSYYKEENSLTMEDAGATQAGSLDINELRIYVDSGSLGPVSADFFIGVGGANININTTVPATTIQENQPVTDIGFKFYFIENKTSLLTNTISAELALRKLTPTSTVVIGTDPVKDLGGINIGINVALMF
ncbi:MAG: hypothetical protein GY756_08790, partial [bacterium]|nr:hypothetical protein [bacterium]